jgi:hypothetical protein
MTVSINWPTGVITIPQNQLTFISGSTYSLDVDAFRLALKDLEDSEEGQVWPDTHRHSTASTLSGVVYARQVEILAPYTVTFEDVGTPYTVSCIGANHNLADVKNVNQVSLIIGNSAGLISVTTGSGVTAQDKIDIVNLVWNELIANHDIIGSTARALATASSGGVDIQALVDGVWNEPKASHTTVGTIGKTINDLDNDVNKLIDVQTGNWEIQGNQMIFYSVSGSEIYRYNLLDKDGAPSNTEVFKRVKV